MRAALVLAMFAGCGFSPALTQTGTQADGGVSIDAPPDAAMPVTCGELTCDPHATCSTTSTNASCTCSTGYTGNGFTCTDIDECATQNGNCAAACQNTDGNFVCYTPQTCADLASHGVAVADASYTLYFAGLATQPYTVYCAGTGANAKEYLSLSGSNTSIYQQGGKSPGTDVKTAFTKIRFVTTTSMIDTSDRTFATSTGMLNHSGDGTMVTSMPYGVAMNCKGQFDMSTTANFDLTATKFAFTGNGAFSGGGSGFANATTFSSNNQKVKLQGGGNCGWDAPTNAPSNPFNANVDANNGQLLGLVYVP